ncbi:hypothetical protein [Endozoicomonas euniceicola]|uniref:Uncharacterized protein n=1 Tax=Endozoicomonas euniceicola TaxID=1234143 RepID=A0ABY6GV97_9GAMM|nr:hypothetical protein [Endozoicomonas euniceicola]UYM16314.1 hypothetical protein NX720_26560 [Endozoicomonas euniceicola]
MCQREECSVCGCDFDRSDFDFIDDEFDEINPTCPKCQEQSRISKETCDHCADPTPAEYEVSDFYLCEYHYEHYVDGYKRD